VTTAIVTGGGGGIGSTIARRLAQEGHTVFVADRSETAANQTAASIRESGMAAVAVPCDVSEALSVDHLCGVVAQADGRLVALINCAAVSGVDVKRDLFEITPAEWRRVIDVNLTGTFLTSQAAARLMAPHGGGCIVNIASVSGLIAEERAAAYCASKAGIIGLTRAMAVDLAALGIRVCAVAPGDIATAKSREVAETEPQPRFPRRTPLGQGEPEDVAAAVAFLVSEGGRFITGSTLVVDGGLVAHQ
jgi:NAD(P)-dependent dehydrogenase (short-subunit alcohol dehydrogenase family)